LDDDGRLSERGSSCTIDERSAQNGDNVGAGSVLEFFEAKNFGGGNSGVSVR
jgi:hypothetical protein